MEYTGEAISINLKDEVEAVTRNELTNLIQNPSFEEDGSTLSAKAPKGWTANCNTTWWGVNKGGGNGDPAATEGEYIFGVWDSNTGKNAEISQTITLPAGHYELTVDMQATNQGTKMRVGNQRLFANEASALFKDQVMTFGSTDNEPLQTITLEFYVENDDTPVKIGVTTDGAQDQTWYKIDNFRLYSVNRPVKTLDENVAFAETGNTLTDVELVRSFNSNDQWDTYCVPFDMTAEDVAANFADIKQLSEVISDEQGITLNFTDATTITAGVPYLVKVNNAAGSMLFKDALIKTAAPVAMNIDNVSMQGTYSPIVLGQDHFNISEDAFNRVSQDTDLKGYRAYITLSGEGTDAINKLYININGKPTSVEDIADVDKLVNVSNLSGITLKYGVKESQALDNLPKGVYIVNGKKVMK